MSSFSIDQEIALLEETKTAIFLIREGLISLRSLKNDVDFAHLPILLLSNGFERLLKILIILDAFINGPEKPDFRGIKTHNIHDLLRRVIEIEKKWDYENRCPETKKDIAFLEKCDDLQKFVELLTNFVDKSGRYYNVDLLIGKKKDYSNPSELFILYLDDKTRQGISDTICHTITLIQQFARALCRMFIWGDPGQTGKDMAGIVGYFLDLQDSQLGLILPDQ